MPLLHNFDAEHFLAHHWQKRPLLLRGGVKDFVPFLSRDDLLGLGTDPQTPSRFVSVDDTGAPATWHGPFDIDPDTLGGAPWTILVQSIETVSHDAWALLDRFSFLPRARLDDLMVSYATAGGGIGPHFDLYDVFLVQGTGTRRWRYADRPLDAEHDHDASGHFAFEADHDVAVEPGDVLYLPPRVPHEGTALTASTTYSVGAAAPAYADLSAEFFAYLSGEPGAAGLAPTGLYADAAPRIPAQRSQVPQHLVDETLKVLQSMRIDASVVETFLGRLLTGPKAHTVFDEGPVLDEAGMRARLSAPGKLRLTPPTRMMHDGAGQIFMNGRVLEADADHILRALAETRSLTLPLDVPDEIVAHFAEWLEEGTISLDDG